MPAPIRRAKIVCTLGPATRDPERIRALVDVGMDVARLNFSHGTHEEHRAMLEGVRGAAAAAGKAVAVLADLQGPKIRLGRFAGGEATLVPGAEFVITTEPVEGTAARAATSYPGFARDVRSGDAVLLDDGHVRLEVLDVRGSETRTRVVVGGRVSDHKGINLPGVEIRTPALTDKDRDDLAFALAHGADWVALSFVRDPADADAARRAMGEAGARVPLIAKLEKPEAVERLAEVLDAFDGIMVARGDLGVEMPLQQVPITQRRAVRLARDRGKPVIVATQMLDSMIASPRPTRAEVSDVAHAVFEGADALMLSGETSSGAHPEEAVATMARIALAAEADAAGLPPLRAIPGSRQDAIAEAATRIAEDLGASALVAFTISGATARSLARHRSRVPVIAFTTAEAVCRRLAPVWGVEAHVLPAATDTDRLVAEVDRALLDRGRARRGDAVVIVAGTPPGVTGSTNTIRVQVVGGA